jgi:hypothetical protein
VHCYTETHAPEEVAARLQATDSNPSAYRIDQQWRVVGSEYTFKTEQEACAFCEAKRKEEKGPGTWQVCSPPDDDDEDNTDWVVLYYPKGQLLPE